MQLSLIHICAYPAEPLLTNAYSAVFGTPSAIYPGYQLAYLPNPKPVSYTHLYVYYPGKKIVNRILALDETDIEVVMGKEVHKATAICRQMCIRDRLYSGDQCQ